MKNIMAFLKTESKDYPLVFNLNVMEEIQEEYGSMNEWALRTSGGDKEPKIKDIKAGLLAMINEGIDILNDENGTKEPFITSKKLGRIIDEIGLEETINQIQKITLKSVNTDKEEPKNM